MPTHLDFLAKQHTHSRSGFLKAVDEDDDVVIINHYFLKHLGYSQYFHDLLPFLKFPVRGRALHAEWYRSVGHWVRRGWDPRCIRGRLLHEGLDRRQDSRQGLGPENLHCLNYCFLFWSKFILNKNTRKFI